MNKQLAIDKGVSHLAMRVRDISLVGGVMCLLIGIYSILLGSITYYNEAVFTDQLGMGIAFVIMSAMQVPSWKMAQNNRPKKLRH